MSHTFKFFADPSHGWLCVPHNDVISAGLTAADFSRYSFVRAERTGTRYYLEEDCDAPKFITAYEAKHGVKVKFAESFCNSPSLIRRLPSIRD